jgi:hypothetical protein
MFIKHGDGKIISVFKKEDIDEQQKTAINEVESEIKKESYIDHKDLKSKEQRFN